MITFIPLSVPYAAAGSEISVRTKLEPNAPEEEHPRALAYLLQMDDVRVLIDCGSPEDFLFSDPTHSEASATLQAEAESSSMAQQREADSAALDLNQLKAAPLDTLLRQLAPTIDLVLLSHSSLDHLGLYAYAHARLGLKCQVYATMPVQSMGKLTVLEAIQTWRSEVDIEKESLSLQRRCLPSVDEVEDAFEEIKTVRYMQPTHLEGKCASLTLTAYNAGHSLGGAIWKIRSPTSGTVVVALDWNHNRERHLDGTILLSSSAAAPGAPGSGSGADAVRRPDLLITEVERGLVVNTRRKDRDAALIDLVHTTIQAGNSVLFPIDASARLLELMVLLDQHWAYAYPHARFPLCLISRTGKEVIERSRTYMEWMTREWATKANETIEADKDKQLSKNQPRSSARGNRPAAASSPLDFKYVKVFSSLQAMDEAIPQDQAKVVLAVPPSMTHGPSRRLLARFAANPNDLVILISRGEPNSLCRQLWDAWSHHQSKGFSWSHGKLGQAVVPNTSVRFELKSKVPLAGEELRAHLEAEQAERDRLAQQRALLARSRRRLEADEDDSSDSDSDGDDGDEQGEDVYDVARTGSGEAPSGNLIRKRPYGAAFSTNPADDAAGQNADTNQLSFDIYLKGNASRATSFFGSKAGQEGPFGLGVRYRLFPAIERKRMVDGFGEVTDVARWLSRRRAVEAAESAAADPLSESAALTAEAKRKKAAEEEARAAAAIPSKFITELVDLVISCKVAFIEMTGLNDGRALKTLIPQLHPRRLIMINGDTETRQDMQTTLEAIKSLTKDVYAPEWMQSIRIGEVTNSYTVNLGEGLLAGLQLSRFEEFEVAHVRAIVRAGGEGAGAIPVLETEEAVATAAVVGDEDEESTSNEIIISELTSSGIIRSAPSTNIHPIRIIPSHPPSSSDTGGTLFIGDLKLTTLKSTLSSPQFRLPADFAGEGMLVCGSGSGGEAVTVQKQAKGRIVIEGNVTKSFGTVRRAVYGLHARVAGGASGQGQQQQQEQI
ncbi:related to CFT2 - subunit of the mRNA cleavage and polyadenlylation factor [Ustilago trichophora]|uniref:Cleavage and polyadenylation specificity factor subunit 2 n=1 Tax=Ustilago trichophora TaxID=86804 RepID=A0A5C3E2C2_9BASI|nr:related to CFT2 - subunit of the mRNA cleavage and polyadenlylation factor [Ustilago trichophora]